MILYLSLNFILPVSSNPTNITDFFIYKYLIYLFPFFVNNVYNFT